MPINAAMARRLSLEPKWRFCIGISLCAALLTYWPQGLSLFRYDRAGLLAGEGWRIATAHLVHLNSTHLVFNLLGLFLLCELLWAGLPLRHAAGMLGASGLAVSVLLWWQAPHIAWYVGLSGALHGLWAGCALRATWGARAQSVPPRAARTLCAAGLLVLMLKLALEWLFGASQSTAQAIGAPVIAQAHCYGALTGAVYVAMWRAAEKLPSRR
ncbi:MAG: Rhomboid family protein [Herminiimonas sp.]|nr:Rhomboid family protein [Herminiimonas sp.]